MSIETKASLPSEKASLPSEEEQYASAAWEETFRMMGRVASESRLDNRITSRSIAQRDWRQTAEAQILLLCQAASVGTENVLPEVKRIVTPESNRSSASLYVPRIYVDGKSNGSYINPEIILSHMLYHGEDRSLFESADMDRFENTLEEWGSYLEKTMFAAVGNDYRLQQAILQVQHDLSFHVGNEDPLRQF